jgi:hypothetical protein
MTVAFTLDEAKSFDQNFASFLDAVEGIDGEMAAILRANAGALAQIVMGGERDSNARAAFNSAIAQALDELATTDPEPGPP